MAYCWLKLDNNFYKSFFSYILILVSDSEKRRLHDAFRLSSSSSSTLGKSVFSTAVLGESVPSALTEQVFSLVGGGRGVTFRELLTLLVLVTRGTREEKFKCEQINNMKSQADIMYKFSFSHLWYFICGVRHSYWQRRLEQVHHREWWSRIHTSLFVLIVLWR